MHAAAACVLFERLACKSCRPFAITEAKWADERCVPGLSQVCLMSKIADCVALLVSIAVCSLVVCSTKGAWGTIHVVSYRSLVGL